MDEKGFVKVPLNSLSVPKKIGNAMGALAINDLDTAPLKISADVNVKGTSIASQ